MRALAQVQILAFSLLLIPIASRAADKPANKASATQTAIFAGGCFWCMEPAFEKLDGVLSVVSGYTGGHKDKPTYHEVSNGGTGHVEAVQVTFDPKKITYQKLLDNFWLNVDPLDASGQFCDKGDQYQSEIFVSSDEQRKLAEASKKKISESAPFKGKQLVTKITDAKTFYPAEDYHQDYYKKNPIRYKYYRYACGRDQKLESYWGAAAAKH